MVRYKGTGIAFANALWIDFELVNQIELPGGVIEAHLLKRGDKSVDDLIKNLQGHVAIEAIQLEQPNMDDVFITLLENLEKK